MKTTVRTLLSRILLISLVALFGCSLDGVQDTPDADTQSVLDNVFAESEFTAIRTLFDIEAQGDDMIKKTSAGLFCSCSQVTVNEIADLTYEMEVDFGAGCTCLDGRKRAGKLIGIFHGKWSQEGSYVEITPENYQVSNLQGLIFDFEFEKKITYQGLDNDGYPTWITEVKDAILRNQGEKIRWDATHTVKWIEGIADLDPTDNVYLLSSTATGVNLNGLAFYAETESDLRIEASCSHPTSGIIALTPAGKLTRKLDFGDGECDQNAVFSIDEFSVNIKLR